MRKILMIPNHVILFLNNIIDLIKLVAKKNQDYLYIVIR